MQKKDTNWRFCLAVLKQSLNSPWSIHWTISILISILYSHSWVINFPPKLTPVSRNGPLKITWQPTDGPWTSRDHVGIIIPSCSNPQTISDRQGSPSCPLLVSRLFRDQPLARGPSVSSHVQKLNSNSRMISVFPEQSTSVHWWSTDCPQGLWNIYYPTESPIIPERSSMEGDHK